MGYSNTKWVIALISATLLGMATSYPNSVPNNPDVCSKMIPGHGPRPQKDPSPYEIILNKQKMQGGNNLQIVIQGKNNQKFKGFYIQARDQDGMPIGAFLIPDENHAGTHNCFDLKNNAAHHKNNIDKDSVTVYWKAPESFDGQVRVLATVLKDFETYWTNVKAPELVSVSQTSNSIFPVSSTFPEKRKTESAENSKATRILNYNPYSPFSPLALSSWGETPNDNLSSPSAEEHMLPEASEDSSVTEPRERQLFGIPNFDFHGGSLFSPPKASPPPRKPKNVHFSSAYHAHSHDYNRLPYTESLDDGYHHSSLYGHSSYNERPPKTIFKSPKVSYNKFGIGQPYKEKPSEYLFSPQKPTSPFSYPHSDSPYHFSHLPPQTIHESSVAPIFPSETYPPLHKPAYTPHLAQSVESDKGSHYLINHHYLHKPAGSFHKPASDPSYPNSGYFPKDILTKITSYLPNIYNALTNNPLFNLNVDNTFESIWKPVKGHIPNKYHYDHHGSGLSTSASTTKVEMPKYGYLVYNPVRKNPYFVIPAENEDEFVANHMGRTVRRRKDRKDITPMYIPKSV